MFTLTNIELVQAIAPVAAVVPARTPLEAMQRIELEAVDGVLSVRGATFEMAVETKTNVSGDLPSLRLTADRLNDVVNSLPDGPIEVSADDKQVIFRSKGGRAALVFYPKDAFKRTMTFPTAHTMPMDGSLFADALGRVGFAVDEKSSLVSLAGLCLRLKPDGVFFAGGCQSCIAEFADKVKTECAEEIVAIIPLSTAKMVARHMGDEPLSLSIGETGVVFSNDTIAISGVLIAQHYPDYRDVRDKIQKASNLLALVETKPLLEALSRKVPFLERSKEIHLVELEFDYGELTVRSQMGFGESVDTLPVEYSGVKTKVTLNYKQLTAIVRQAKSGSLQIDFSDPKKPFLFTEIVKDSQKSFQAFMSAVTNV